MPAWLRNLLNALLGRPTPPAPPPAPKPPPRPPVVQPVSMPNIDDLVPAFNVERLTRAVPAVVRVKKLDAVAAFWAGDTAAKGVLTHGSTIQGTDSGQRVWHVFPGVPEGEIIAEGQVTIEQLVKSWMDSPGHRRIILDPQYDSVGVGEAKDAQGRLWWCADWARLAGRQ